MRPLLTLLLFVTGPVLLYAQGSAGSPYPVIRLTDSVRCTNVKDQSQSPTCWVFGTNSLFESDILRKTGKRFNLSEMFIARYAYIEKAKVFLATKGKTYFEGGGNFHDVIRVVNKYGLVPEDVYDGKPNKENYHNHAGLDTSMKVFIHSLLRAGKTEMNARELQQVNDTLDKYLGKLPGTFWYDLETRTPENFAKEILPSTTDYIEIMSFANLPYYKKCLLQDKFNWAGDSLYNVPLNDLQTLVDTALAKGWSVGWEGDVTNTGFDFWNGYATVNDSIQEFSAARTVNFKNETTERDHMLHLVGRGTDENNKHWYYLKNSWGTMVSSYKGFLFMDENYFRLNTVIIMVNKEGLPENLKGKLGL